MKAIGGAAFINQVVGMGREMSGLAAKQESLAMTFKVMMGGNKQAADQLLKDLTKFSDVTPFEPEEVNMAAQSFLQARLPLEKLMPLMTTVGDLAAGTGKNYAELASKIGRVYMLNKADNELLQQTPVLYGALAKILGKNEREIFAMASAGKIGFKEVEQAILSLTTAGGTYAGMMDELSKTTEGLTSTEIGYWDGIKKAIGYVINLGLKPFLDFLIPLTKSFKEFLETERGIAIIKASLIGLFVLVAGVGVMAFWSLAVAVLSATWPILLIAAGVTALILIFEDLYQFFTGGKSLFGRYFIDPIKKGLFWLVVWFKELPDRMLAGIRALPGMIGDLLIGLVPDWVIRLISDEEETKPKKKKGHARGHRASGGPVTSGNPYLVGEQGPEIFMPNNSGTIIPNGKATASGRITLNSLVGTINIYANNSKEAASKFESEIMKVINKLSKNVFAAELGVNI